jgi:simple sugar transport system permease protein
LRGDLKEMEVIITVIIGGTLLTGGYGSPVGTFLGCLTLGLLRQGIYMLDIPSEWYQAVLGLVLIIAVLINKAGRRLEKL